MICKRLVGLVVFSDISTVEGYLIPNLAHIYIYIYIYIYTYLISTSIHGTRKKTEKKTVRNKR